MTRDDIELMVTRLRGFWPSQAIALDTTKEAWSRSDVLLRLSVGGGKAILDAVKNEKQFPSLGQVEQIARRLLSDEKTETCGLCSDTGWYYPAEMLDENGLRRLDIPVGVKRCQNCQPGQ